MRTGRSFCTLKKKILIVLIVVFVVLSGLWYAFFYKGDNTETKTYSETPPTDAPSPSPTITPKVLIVVHICGSVNSPGVVGLEKGDRLITAVLEAGGFTENADRGYLNLARMPEDGERIYVPSVEETAELSLRERMEGSGFDDGSGSDSGYIKPININKARAEELTVLPGIGESRAKDIIAYRNRVGPFEKKEDIKNVSGIGESLYSKIVDHICVE